MVEEGAAERKQISAAVGPELHQRRAIRRRGDRDSALAPSLRQKVWLFPCWPRIAQAHRPAAGRLFDDVVVDLFEFLQLGWRGFWRGRQRLRR